MGACMIFGQSGGTGLSVIYGATRPADAAENTVWCKTDIDAPGYIVSPVQPTGCDSGTLWVKTADSGNKVELGTKNPIVLLISGVRQLSGRTWNTMEYSVFVSGAWTEIGSGETYIFNNGDKCTAVTGGWTTSGYSFSYKGSTVPLSAAPVQNSAIALNALSDKLIFLGTSNAVSLDGVSQIEIDWVANSASSDVPSDTLILQVSNKKSGFGLYAGISNILEFGARGSRRKDTVNVSGVSGND